MAAQKGPLSRPGTPPTQAHPAPRPAQASDTETPPILAPAIPQRFEPTLQPEGLYLPALAARGEVRYFNAARGIDIREPLCLLNPLDPEAPTVTWEEAEPCEEEETRAPATPSSGTAFAPLPPFVAAAKNLKPFEKTLKNHLYATRRLTLYRCRPLKAESRPKESLEDFRGRLMELLEERRSQESDKLEARYAKKLQTLQERYRRALQKIEKEKADVAEATTGSLIDAGMALFGAFFGSRRSAASKVSRAVKGGSRLLKEKADVARAEAQAAEIEEKIDALHQELEAKLDALEEKWRLENFPVEPFFIKPRRSDIRIDATLLLWRWLPPRP